MGYTGGGWAQLRLQWTAWLAMWVLGVSCRFDLPRSSGVDAVVDVAVAPIDVKVHYKRADGQYTGWGLHVWQVNEIRQYIADYPGVSWGSPLQPAGNDAYGPYFLIEVTKVNKLGATGFGFIVHQDDTKDTDIERTWVFQDGADLWLKSDDPSIYHSNPG